MKKSVICMAAGTALMLGAAPALAQNSIPTPGMPSLENHSSYLYGTTPRPRPATTATTTNTLPPPSETVTPNNPTPTFGMPSKKQHDDLLYDDKALPQNNVQPNARATNRTAGTPPAIRPVPQPKPEVKGLLTQTEWDVGFQFSHQNYREPDLNDTSTGRKETVHLRGLQYGVTSNLTVVLYDKWFARLDGRYAYGAEDYKFGAFRSDGEDVNIGEVRLLGGRDILFNNANFSLTPYMGIGYRYLYNDARGVAAANGIYSNGYRRASQYLYMPVGVTPRTMLTSDIRLSVNLEYDQLLFGKQKSQLGDAGVVSTGVANPSAGIYSTVTNNQHSGYGLRGEAMVERGSWALGPFFDYWNIDRSDDGCSTLSATNGNSYQNCSWVEPRNQTLEYGLQVRYRLF